MLFLKLTPYCCLLSRDISIDIWAVNTVTDNKKRHPVQAVKSITNLTDNLFLLNNSSISENSEIYYHQ